MTPRLTHSLLRIVRRNLSYKVLSLAISVMLYLIATAQINPHTTTDVYIQPQVTGLSENMVVRVAPAGSTVSVAGTSANVNAFKSEGVKAVVDVSRARVGANQLPVIYKTPAGVELSGEPKTADVTLERKFEKDYYVDVLSDEASPPSGYEFTDPIVEPRKVTVSGLASDVGRVARVVAILEKGENTGAIYQNVDLVAQDERQQTVDAVQIDRPRVLVRLGLRRAPASKAVLLSARLMGTPAPGYAVTQYTFTPPMVMVSGTQEKLTSRSSLAVPVNIDGASASVTRRVPLEMPPGLTLQNPGDATVQVRVDLMSVASPTPGPVMLASPAPHPTPTTSAAPSLAPREVTVPSPSSPPGH